MLSTNSTSSIQKRRQTHRRQQSLEVPILATPLHANPRRSQLGHHGHRRGLSLDQSLSALTSPTGFRKILSQDQNQLPGTPPVLTKPDNTNTGPPSVQQHFVQETQQQIPAKPGYQAQDFQAHLSQQVHGNISSHIVAPTPTHPNQQQALQELQHHMEWYNKNFGVSVDSSIQSTQFFNMNEPFANEMTVSTMPTSTSPRLNGATTQQAQTPVVHGHSHTVPNTPQHATQDWPSPPPSKAKHARSQSFQLDLAPMPNPIGGAHVMHVSSSPFTPAHASFTQDSFTADDEHAYASSAYSSSVVDHMSPGCHINAGPMPTVFEEITSPSGTQIGQGGLPEEDILFNLTGDADPADFDMDLNLDLGPGNIGMSPRTAALHDLGPGVNCTIIDTGIPSKEIEDKISSPHPVTKEWHCLYKLENGATCNKSFRRRENARSHVQNHLDDRQFQCNDCLKTFVRAHDMKRHSQIHTDNRPHLCPCGSGFARHDALTRHRQRGMCAGALPGFEKAEEERPKRGRPKKDRPAMESRTTKASRARQMDRKTAATDAAYTVYASSSSVSAMSDHGFPDTPPYNPEFDTDVFINMANADMHFNSATSSWRDTPPTSPASGSPAKTTTDFDFNAPLSPVNSISPAMLYKHSYSDHSSPAAAADADPSASFNKGSEFFDAAVAAVLDNWLANQ